MDNRHNLPKIPGLRLRNFQGADDFRSIASIISASETADGLERNVKAEDIAQAYQHLVNCDPSLDVFIADVDGMAVGCARGWWEQMDSSEFWYFHNGFLVPEWRRKGIGSALLSAVELRQRELAQHHPPEAKKLFLVDVTQLQLGAAILLERNGYQPARYYDLMVRSDLEDIPDFPLPQGVELRPVKPEHYPAIWKVVDETSQDEWGHRKLNDDDYQAWLENPHFQPDLWQIAWDVAGDEVAGTVLTYIDHSENEQLGLTRGYTEGIGVVRSWRRRGLARALISLSLRAQKAAGMTESALVVDSENPSDAASLYTSCGFKVARRSTLYKKPF
jgi:GNAT superfamily N-acetyltransferase